MPALQFPSAQFPALTAVEITAPDGWEPINVDDTELAVVRPGEPGQFLSNLIVTVRRFPSSYSLQEAVDNLETSLTIFGELTDRGGGIMPVGGFPGYARELSYVDPEAGPLAHSVRLALVPLAGTESVDVVDVRATVLLAREDPDHLEVVDMLGTLKLHA